MLPAASILLGVALGGIGFLQLQAALTLQGLPYSIQNARLVAGLFAGFAFAGFVLGRYLLATAQRGPGGLIRGGATYLIGTVYVFAVMALAAGAKALGTDAVNGVAMYVVPLFMLVVGVETLLNLVLDLYRPRAAGEQPRPAFDSRLLNLLASPGGVVRSLNEAINYQFGFEITRSWFWRLLSRSFVWLLLFGVGLLVLLSSLVLIQPQEMALVTRFGKARPRAAHARPSLQVALALQQRRPLRRHAPPGARRRQPRLAGALARHLPLGQPGGDAGPAVARLGQPCPQGVAGVDDAPDGHRRRLGGGGRPGAERAGDRPRGGGGCSCSGRSTPPA